MQITHQSEKQSVLSLPIGTDIGHYSGEKFQLDQTVKKGSFGTSGKKGCQFSKFFDLSAVNYRLRQTITSLDEIQLILLIPLQKGGNKNRCFGMRGEARLVVGMGK